MSHSDNQVLQVAGFDDDDDDEEVGGGGGGVRGNHEEKERKKKKQRGFDCTRNIRRAKQVVLSNLKQKPKPHQSNLLSSSSATTANAAPSGTTTKGCCFCFKKPLTLDSPVDESLCSDPNDPNDPNFSFDMLKSLIENNDFYSKESNPHLHVSPD